MLHGKVVGIESGSKFTDGKRRVTVKIAEGDYAFNELRIAEDALGLGALSLDDELELETDAAVQAAREPAKKGTRA